MTNSYLKEIEQWVKHNHEEWSALTQRFVEMDSTISNEDVARIYLGYTFTDDYDSFGEDWIQIYAMSLNPEKIGDALDMAWQSHCKNPFNLDVLNFMVTTVPQGHELWRIMAWHFAKLLRGILSTGNGEDMEHAIMVTSVNDEYLVLRNGLEVEKIESVRMVRDGERCYDVFKVLPTASCPLGEVWMEITPSKSLQTLYLNSLR